MFGSPEYWPVIDDALRQAVHSPFIKTAIFIHTPQAWARGVDVQLLIGNWSNSYPPMFSFLRSLALVNDAIVSAKKSSGRLAISNCLSVLLSLPMLISSPAPPLNTLQHLHPSLQRPLRPQRRRPLHPRQPRQVHGHRTSALFPFPFHPGHISSSISSNSSPSFCSSFITHTVACHFRPSPLCSASSSCMCP
jgi:hypothetical protein